MELGIAILIKQQMNGPRSKLVKQHLFEFHISPDSYRVNIKVDNPKLGRGGVRVIKAVKLKVIHKCSVKL